MKFEPKSSGSLGNYVKLKGGESVKGVFRGDPFDFRQHWHNNRSTLCLGSDECPLCKEGHKSSFRFRINFLVSENATYVAKVFEQGWNSYEALKSLHESDYDLEKTIVKISRTGNGPNDTSYSITPLPKWEVSKELEKKLLEIKLNDLKNPEDVAEESEPEGTVPF